jgi:hypothetical protein
LVLKMPPPRSLMALLLENVLFAMVNTAPEPLKIPPPLLALLFRKVMFVMVDVPLSL